MSILCYTRAILIWFMLLGATAAVADDHPLGTLVDVGGYRLYLDCRGQGSPAVILDAGLGGSAADWRKVQEALAVTTRVCTYDRAGYGHSDPGPQPRTSSRIASELRTLLERAGVSPPFVLVGHSFGGYNMRLFAGLYPQDTAGLVLVDALHEGQTTGFFQTYLMREIDPLGLLSQVWRSDLLADILAFDWQPLAALLGMEIKTLQAIVGEAAALQESADEVRTLDVQENIPLVVIMHGERVLPPGALGDEMERQWLELQRALASRYKRSTFLIARSSGHNIPLDQPDLIVDAIRELIGAT